uniref:60S ribosomal protein L31 n=1 Tax=Heterosigma akashiwo TaxID=2829 RepID=A0A7S3YCZ3_HETAK
MVQKSLKGKVLGKEKKLAAVAERRKAVSLRAKKDDNRWNRVLNKMSADKKAKFSALTKVARRGITRRALNRKNERKPDSIAYECTIHMAKFLKGKTFHKRAPTAVKKIRAFAHKMMRTKDNRVDATLNNFLWSRGVKGVPKRVRVLIQRKVAEQGENGSGRKHLYSVITHVPCESFEGTLTKTVVKQ